MSDVDVNSPPALALRALQRLDEEMSLAVHRHLLIQAEGYLGLMLGLSCTGTTTGWYDEAGTKPAAFSHNGDTCPIHEWLVPDDARFAQR